MENYAILINTDGRIIVVDDRNAQEEYVFTEKCEKPTPLGVG